jgi:hypothetical protein
MATKKHFFGHGKFLIKDGSEVRFWEDKWLGTTTLREQYPALYDIVRHKGDAIAQVLESTTPNVSFRRSLYGPRLVSWESLLQCLDTVQLTDGKDEFHWNLLENGKFPVASMYNVLISSDLPVLDNKKIWNMKIPLKNKKIAWYLRRGVILTKDNLIKRNWHGSKSCVFCCHDETIKHLFFQCNFARSILSVIQAASGLYPPTSVANIFGNWVHGIDNKYRTLLRVGAIALIWSLWLCRNDKVFDNKKILFCRLSTGVRAPFVYGHSFTTRRITTSSQRCAHGWRIQRGTSFRSMDGSIICALALHHLRRLTISQSDM